MKQMIISNVPRLKSRSFPIFTSPLTHFFISKTPKKQFLIFSTPFSKPFSTTLFTKTSDKNPSTPQESRNQEKIAETPQIELSIEKPFLPPDTDVSSLSTALNSRVLKGSNIVLTKYASDAQVDYAEFVKSSVKIEDCPSDGLPEFALVGRSNVGKSSLLNSLVRQKRLALTSKKSGSQRF